MTELDLEPTFLESLTSVPSENFPIPARVRSLRIQLPCPHLYPAVLITVANIY